MRCIFCKSDTSKSKSIEHIIPESLGNTEHILPVGVVCDKCNNYFARKIEKPLLESIYFEHLRFHKSIKNKRGLTPAIWGVSVDPAVVLRMANDPQGYSIYPDNPKDFRKFASKIFAKQKFTMIVPVPTDPDKYVMARFLGKVGLEILAQRLLNTPNGLNEIVDKSDLDRLRTYVRLGDSKKAVWEFHERRLYADDSVFYEVGYGHYEMLHEYTLLYTDTQDLYVVLALFGKEYVLNLGESSIKSYVTWLEQNQGNSPLYPTMPNLVSI